MRPMLPLMLAALLGACAPAVTVRAPMCELKPLPARDLEPCEKLRPIADGKLETLYLQAFVDTAIISCWARRFSDLLADLKHRDDEFRKCQLGQPDDKPWWKKP